MEGRGGNRRHGPRLAPALDLEDGAERQAERAVGSGDDVEVGTIPRELRRDEPQGEGGGRLAAPRVPKHDTDGDGALHIHRLRLGRLRRDVVLLALTVATTGRAPEPRPRTFERNLVTDRPSRRPLFGGQEHDEGRGEGGEEEDGEKQAPPPASPDRPRPPPPARLASPAPARDRTDPAAVGARVLAADVFDRADTCEKVWDRLLSGAVLDALLSPTEAPAATGAQVDTLMHALKEAVWEPIATLGQGQECRLALGPVVASTLALEGVIVRESVVVG